MAKKRPAYMFYTGDWMKDPALSSCSLSTRGFWIDALSAMHEMDTGEISGTYENLARMCRCFPDEAKAAVDELSRSDVADVMVCNGNVTLVCRRMMRDAKVRNGNRLRVSRHRCNGDGNENVTPPSSVSVSVSVSKPISEPDPIPTDLWSIAEEPDRVFEVEKLKPLWAKCGWGTVEKMVEAWKSIEGPRRPSFERFLAMLVEKWETGGINKPAGATICAFKSGQAPTDTAMQRLKDILRPPGKRECKRVSQFDQDCDARNRFFRAGVEA